MSKTVLITGATSGIGQQLAIDYAKRGFNVIACGRNQSQLDMLSSAYNHVETLAFDITNREQTLQQLSELKWTPDIWLLNAGNCEYLDNGVMDAELFERVIQVNLVGVANCIQAIQPHFQAGQSLAFVGSIASEVALPRAEAYGASKAALSYLARSIAQPLKRKGVRVTTIYPGFVETPLTDKNTFDMPMMVSAAQASRSIQTQLDKGKTSIFFPFVFTALLRFISLLPYSWQVKLTEKLI